MTTLESSKIEDSSSITSEECRRYRRVCARWWVYDDGGVRFPPASRDHGGCVSTADAPDGMAANLGFVVVVVRPPGVVAGIPGDPGVTTATLAAEVGEGAPNGTPAERGV